MSDSLEGMYEYRQFLIEKTSVLTVKEQIYVKNCINDMKEIPHVLIHDGFIVKNKYTLNERFWSIKKI